MDRRPALVAAVALAAVLVLVAVWQAVPAPTDAPASAALLPSGVTTDPAEPGPGEPARGEDTPAPRPATEPEQDPAEPARAAASQNHTASCSFQHRGARSPQQSVGVLDSGVRCQFRVDALAWTAVRVTVHVDGVQAHPELTATLYAHRAGGMRELGSSSTAALGAATTLAVTADPAALGPYRVFELELDGVGASAVDVRVDAVLTA